MYFILYAYYVHMVFALWDARSGPGHTFHCILIPFSYLINNALIGISAGYEIVLNLNGVGFRASLEGKKIKFQLGFSHDILFDVPEGITVKIDKQTKITLNGNDKQLIGKVASDIKFLKPVEPYKQKGITADGQFILKKEGKKK